LGKEGSACEFREAQSRLSSLIKGTYGLVIRSFLHLSFLCGRAEKFARRERGAPGDLLLDFIGGEGNFSEEIGSLFGVSVIPHVPFLFKREGILNRGDDEKKERFTHSAKNEKSQEGVLIL